MSAGLEDDEVASMTRVVREWRDQHGDAIARELIRAYLTGVNHGISILMKLGPVMTEALFGALEGN